MRGLLIMVLVILMAGPTNQVGSSTQRGSQRVPTLPESFRGQDVQVDTLLARVLGTEDQDTYELTADFKGAFNVVVRGSPFTAYAVGTYRETRKAGEARRRKITLQHLDLPLLLRPFSGVLQRAIEGKVELQSDNPETFYAHDIFMLEEPTGRRYVLGGVHRDIVDEAIDRYGHAGDKKDPAIRRNIARWLYTSPTMRSWIVRPGPPYALRTVIDDSGLIYDLGLFYNWGQIGTKISYLVVNGQSVWREVVTDTVSELSGHGRVDGQLTLTFSNHCLNCRN